MRALALATLAVAITLASVECGAQTPPAPLEDPKLKLTEAVCIDDLFAAIPLEIVIPRVPLGCELIDCCPGCGYRPDIDLSIAVSSGLESSTVVEFDNLEADEAAELVVTGGTLAGTTLQFEGRANLAGIPRKLTTASVAMRPRIGIVPFDSPGDVTKDDVDELDNLVVSVTQSVDSVEISSARFQYEFKVCSPGIVYDPPLTDELNLVDNAFGDDSAIVLDARREAGCMNGHRTDAAATATYANLKSPTGACRQEIAVFSEGDAATLLADEDKAGWAAWTDTAGDTQEVDLNVDPWEVPIRIWISAPESTAEVYYLNQYLSSILPVPLVFDSNNTTSKLLVRVTDEIDEANYLFDTNKAGVDVKTDVQYTIVNNIVAMAGVYTAGLFLWTDCAKAVSALAEYKKFSVDILGLPPIHEEGAINVYYIGTSFVAGGVSTITGAECPNGLIVVGSGASETTLAHELGHAFSLRHVRPPSDLYDCDADGASDFAANNIMWWGGIDRDEFTIGQNWHINFNDESILNWPGLSNTRVGPSRSCGDGSGTVECACYGVR
jgi:hypothetical protein